MTKFLSERGFHIGYGIMLLGVIILLDGLAVDAWLHAHDTTLAAKEGIFTLSNPGHLMIFIGIATVIVGAAIGPYTRFVLPGRSPMLATFAPAIAVGAALAISGAFATEVNGLSHDDSAHIHADLAAAGAAGHTHTLTDVLPENQATVALIESTATQPENNQPITADNLRFAQQFVDDARDATEQFKDVRVAEADGYLRITPDLPLIGAHFFHDGYDGLDPAKPSILLYTGDDNTGWTLVGMAYQLPHPVGDDSPPDSPFGGLAQWHYHSNLCFTAGGFVATAPTEDACPGVFVQQTDWLLHVWAWSASPEGVFSHVNSILQFPGGS